MILMPEMILEENTPKEEIVEKISKWSAAVVLKMAPRDLIYFFLDQKMLSYSEKGFLRYD